MDPAKVDLAKWIRPKWTWPKSIRPKWTGRSGPAEVDRPKWTGRSGPAEVDLVKGGSGQMDPAKVDLAKWIWPRRIRSKWNWPNGSGQRGPRASWKTLAHHCS